MDWGQRVIVFVLLASRSIIEFSWHIEGYFFGFLFVRINQIFSFFVRPNLILVLALLLAQRYPFFNGKSHTICRRLAAVIKIEFEGWMSCDLFATWPKQGLSCFQLLQFFFNRWFDFLNIFRGLLTFVMASITLVELGWYHGKSFNSVIIIN